MSHVAIAAALALDRGLSTAERLAAFSLASYANPEHCAWPGAAAAADRAGLSRGRFLAARDGLERAGLVVVEESRGGRGRSSTVLVGFAATGERLEAEINAPLFEAALTRGTVRGTARLLLAVMAALADADSRVTGFTVEELAAGAGLTETSYRRARNALLASGDVHLDNGVGGRGNANEWTLTLPECPGSTARSGPARRATAGARPLLLPVDESVAAGELQAGGVTPGAAKGASADTVSDAKGATGGTVSRGKSAAGGTVSSIKGAAGRTIPRERAPKREPERAPQSPPPNARAGRESQNLRTRPPNPPQGERLHIQLIEDYVTDRGRRRQRQVTVYLDEIPLSLPGSEHQLLWRSLQVEFRRIVGESTYEIWLDQLQLGGVSDEGELLLACSPPLIAWVGKRYRKVFQIAGETVGCSVRLATKHELELLTALANHQSSSSSDVPFDHKEAV